MIESATLTALERGSADAINYNLIGDVYINMPSLRQLSKKSQRLDNNKLLQLC